MSQQLRNEQIDLIPSIDNDSRTIGSPTKRFSDGYFVKITTSGDISDTIKTVFTTGNLVAFGTPLAIDGYNIINIGVSAATAINIGKAGNATLLKDNLTVTDNITLPPAMLIFSGANGPFVSGISHTNNVALNPGDIDNVLRIDVSLTGGGLWDNGGGANTASTAHTVNFKGGVKGTKVAYNSYMQGLGVGDTVTHSAGVDVWGGITPQFGGTSVATAAAEAVGEFDMANAGGARWSAYTPIPVQTANTAIFHATVTGSPSPNATTIAYTPGTNSDKIGCRFILNKSHAKNDGYVTAVSLDFSNLQTTVTFTGTTFATTDVGRYIKIGANDDLYTISTAADFKGDDIIIDGFGLGHWYRIHSRPSPTQLIIEGIWDTVGFPKSYALIQGAGSPYFVLDGVEISSYTTSSFTTPANTNTWSNGDVLYSPPHHYQGFIGLNLILQKNFRNTYQSVSSNDAIRVRSIGLSPLDVGLELSGTTIDGYGGYIRGIEMIGFMPDVAMDVSNIASNIAAIRLGQNEKLLLDGSGTAPYISGATTDGVHIAGRTGQRSFIATDDFNSDFIVQHTAVGRVDFLDATADTWMVQRQTADVSIGPGGFGNQSITITGSKLFTNKGRSLHVTSITADHIISVNDHCIMVEGISVPITVTLPGAANNGDTYTVKDSQGKAGTYPITVVPSNSDTIDGYTSLILNHDYEAIIFIFDSFADSWATIVGGGREGGGGGLSITPIKTALYTSQIGDLVRCDPSSGGFTVNLPSATGNANNSIVVKNISSSTNTITIDAFGSELIDGSLTQTISIAYQSTMLISDGVGWIRV